VALAAACPDRRGDPPLSLTPSPSSVVVATPASTAAAPPPAPEPAGSPPKPKPSPEPPVIDVPEGEPILGRLSSAERRSQDRLLDHLCAWREQQAADGTRVRGCVCCPPFDTCPPGSKVPAQAGLYELRSAAWGSFTAPGKTQLAAAFMGCEPHAGNYGGTLLLEKDQGKLSRLSYRSGINAQCTALSRADGRDLLLCSRHDVHQGNGVSQIFTYDFAFEDEQAYAEVFGVEDNTQSACTSMAGFPIVHHRIAGLQLVDADGDGKRDLVVKLTAVKGEVTPEYLQACLQESEPDGGSGVSSLSLLPPPKPLKALYLFDGAKLTPTAETKQVVSWLHRELEDFYNSR